MSYNNVILCYTPNQFSRKWMCETGYRNIKEADEMAFQLKKVNENMVTKLYTNSYYYPDFVNKFKIMYDLTRVPEVYVTTRTIQLNDD